MPSVEEIWSLHQDSTGNKPRTTDHSDQLRAEIVILSITSRLEISKEMCGCVYELLDK